MSKRRAALFLLPLTKDCSTLSMCSFSNEARPNAASSLGFLFSFDRETPVRMPSGKSSTVISTRSTLRRTDLSMTLASSRTLPGQSYAVSNSIASCVNLFFGLPLVSFEEVARQQRDVPLLLRSDGRPMAKAFILKKRSLRNLPLSTSLSRSLLVAKINRISTEISLVSPSLLKIPVSRVLSTFAWMGNPMSPTSSIKKVPWLAI